MSAFRSWIRRCFAEIQPQPARIRFVFGDVGFEYVDVLRNALAVVDDEKVDFVSVGARLQCDFGAFGMFDGVQNDVGRRVFQALLFCEYTKGLRHEIFRMIPHASQSAEQYL